MTRLFLLALLAACGPTSIQVDDTATPADTDTDTDSDTDADTDSDTDTDPGLDGEQLYMDNCAECHGTDGRGTREGPDITGEVDRHDDAFLIGVIRNGRERMPAIDVTNEEAQAIVDWMRANF